MAFITRANAGSMLQEINLAKAKNLNTSDLYKVALWPLSMHEQKWLAAARLLYTDFEVFVDSVYSKQKVVDTGQFVYEGIPPAYHAAPNCLRLHSNYKNYLIPIEVENRGLVEVAHFRQWFREHETLLQDNSELFLTRMELHFHLQNPPKLASFEAANSGVEAVENDNLELITKQIDDLLAEATQFRASSSTVTNIIKDYGYRSRHRTGNKDTDEIIVGWHLIKQSLKRKMIKYFKVKFNPQLNFDGLLLEQLGFYPCSICNTNISSA